MKILLLKILMMLPLITFLFSCNPPHSKASEKFDNPAEWSFKLDSPNRMTNEDYYYTEDWFRLQASYQPARNSIYYWGSIEQTDVAPKGKAWTYTMYGIGVGDRIKVSKNIRLFGQIGWHYIENDWGSRKRAKNEGLNYYLNDRWKDSNRHGDYYAFDEFSVSNSNAFSGELGIEIIHPISKNFSFGYSLSYRALQIKEEVHGYRDEWDYDNTGQDWELAPNRDYSSFNFGISINKTFP